MERTLDSIRPSDVEENSRSDMSYLYGRDPSILAYSQRPVPSSKQNLISLYENETEYSDNVESIGVSDTCLETVKVYLRMKPFPRKLKVTSEEAAAYQVTSSTTLVTKLPSLDHTFSSLKGQKNTETICRKFTFTRTFGPDTTQLQLFEEIIQQKMVDFLAGQNCTVMTYGTTNSGKSYTLQGTTTSPGIIPRGLEFVFTNINPRPTPCYKPSHHSNVVCLNAVDRAQEIEAKNKLLTFASIDKHQYIKTYKQMQRLLQEESPIRPSQACDAHYSVWVSFAEIYNENIYDLLSNDCEKRRPVLKLGADSHGRTFIKGLRMVCVNSGSEAYQVLMAGQYNLKVAATALNARSSRSHCIFTIHLLKYYIEKTPSSVELSTFAFCDLAGSERLKKTLNVGDRLKEAQNINTSLLVLGRCLKSIYEGQLVKQRHEHVGPFRESKLTRLFQRALSGKEQIALIVNVNPIPNLYIETQNVLNFSAIAKKIVVEPKKRQRRISNSQFSQIVAQSVKSTTDWDPTELSNVEEQSSIGLVNEASVFIHHEDYEDLMDENKNLRKEIVALKASMFNKDLQIRQELADTYTAMMKQLETDWKNRIRDVEEQQEDNIEWSVNRVETFYKEKLNELTSRKRRRRSESFSDDDNRDLNELEMENTRLLEKINSLKKTIKNLRDNNEAVMTEKNKITFEFGLAKDEIKGLKGLLASAQNDLFKDEENLAYVEELRNQLSNKQQRIKKLEEFLNEAKAEYITITSDVESFEQLLKEREEELLVSEERVADLQELVEQNNLCLAEKTKVIEALEEKVNQKSNMLHELGERNRNEQFTLKETIRSLTDKIATLEAQISSKKIVVNSSWVENEIKKEKLSELKDEVNDDFPKMPITPGLVTKVDPAEMFDIPSTSYEDDRESEVFLQIREISYDSIIPEAENLAEGETVAELRIKLNDCKSKNKVMEGKLSQSLEEIQSLREILHLAKEELNDITKRVKELKDRQDSETRERENSLAIKIRDEIASREDSASQTNVVETNEIFCQTDKILESEGSSGTNLDETKRDEKSVQTPIWENEELKKSEKLLNELKLKHDEIVADYRAKQLSHDEQEVKITVLTKHLASAEAEREKLEKTLNETEEIKKRLDVQVSECLEKHEPKITSLEKELMASNEREAMQTECIKARDDNIAKLENTFATRIKELEEKIVEANKRVEDCQTEKNQLDQRMACNLREMEVLQKRLQESNERDQEKDKEIRQLQISIKTHLSADIEDKKIQKEMKSNLKELLETREALARTDEMYKRLSKSSKKEIEDLETQIEKNAKLLEIAQQKAQHDKADIERLRTERDDLKNLISQKDREMEAFVANRDTMIKKYEELLKHNQEESERAKREVTRFQELFHKLPTTPRGKPCKSDEDDQKNDIPIVDLSHSETKRTTRRAALAPPATENKRSTRKKKLYMPVDDSCIDLEVCDSVPPTPSPSTTTRSLRNRKK